MDYKGLIKYFKPKNMIPQTVGIAIIVFGVLVAILYWAYFGVPIILVGACIVLFTRDSRISDDEVDSTAAAVIKDLDERAREDIGTRERVLRAFMPEVFTGYDYSASAESLLVARGKDTKLRSNMYAAAELIFTEEGLHAYMYRFCLTEPKEDSRRILLKYDELGGASVSTRNERFTICNVSGDSSVEREVGTLEIKNTSGEVVMAIPVDAGADVDRAVETINRLAESKKNK